MYSNTYIQELELKNYRNFNFFKIHLNDNPVILTGENGVGKTNVLEAVSMLFPGRGIRYAKLDEICKIGTRNWQIKALLQSKVGRSEINTNFNLDSKTREIKFNGTKIMNKELNKLATIIWVTEYTNDIFLETPNKRLKFLDRFVYNFIFSHASEINKYEYYIKERLKILVQEQSIKYSLAVIESKIAEVSYKIYKNRLQTIKIMQSYINNLDLNLPKSCLLLDGFIERISSTDNIEELIKKKLYEFREVDKISQKSNFGVHKSNFFLMHQEKGILAKFCSTGERKAMLISIILAQVKYIVDNYEFTPILLLDEVFSYLDMKRKNLLIDFFLSYKLQFWISSTDDSEIIKLKNKFQVIKLV